MQLTKWTDYSLRVLLFCAIHEGRSAPVRIAEIQQAHGISRSHLKKVVMALAAAGYLDTTRGRGGGLRLRRPASEFAVGEIVRLTETDFTLLECFDSAINTCPLAGHCGLQSALEVALERFLAVLDALTLADLVKSDRQHCPVGAGDCPAPGAEGLPCPRGALADG